MLIALMKMPRVREIRFNEKLHRYTDEDELVYTSVTTKIGEFAPKFNENYWATYTANKTGRSKEEVLAEWKEIRERSWDKGNVVHKGQEDSINNSIIREEVKEVLFDNPMINFNPIWGYEISLEILGTQIIALKYPLIFSVISKYVEDGWKIYAEKRVYLYEYLIAGTIDLLLVKGLEFIIIDWKTNKDELKFKSGYYKKVNGVRTDIWIDKKEYMLKPIDKLEHCKGTIYGLQLSIYAYIVECWGYRCRGLILFHLRVKSIESARNIEIVENDVKRYTIPYWAKESNLVLSYGGNRKDIFEDIDEEETSPVKVSPRRRAGMFGIK